MTDNGPPPWIKIIPDSEAKEARADTLNMGEAWAHRPRRPDPPPSPTGFGRPRRRR